MKRRTIGVIEPITRVEGQQLQFRTLRQIRRLVDDQPSGTDTCLDSHGNESSIGRAAQQALAAVGARCDREAPRLMPDVRPTSLVLRQAMRVESRLEVTSSSNSARGDDAMAEK